MAIIRGYGRRADGVTQRRVRDALAEVAEAMLRSGIGRAALVHGSTATGEMTLVETDVATLLASDVDVLLCEGDNVCDRRGLQKDLSALFRLALGEHGSPCSKVSLRTVDAEFWQREEARSLIHSGRVAGVQPLSLLDTRYASRDVSFGRVLFPYAFPYGVTRWLRNLEGNHEDRVLGLYELAKGVMRSQGGCERRVPGAEVIDVGGLLRYLRGYRDWVSGRLSLRVAELWEDFMGGSSECGLRYDAALVPSARMAWARQVRRTWPNTFVAERTEWDGTRCAA